MDKMPSSPSNAPPPGAKRWRQHLQLAWQALLVGLRRYADWLARQSWKRLAVLAVLAIIATALLSQIPPFSTEWGGGTIVRRQDGRRTKPPKPPKAPPAPNVEVHIDENGVRIVPRAALPPGSAASAASAASASSAPSVPEVAIKLPPGADTEEVREAIQEAKEEMQRSIEEMQRSLDEARETAHHAAHPFEEIHIEPFRLGDHLVPLMMLLIASSIIAKVMGAGRKKAEVQAAQATERAEAESLRRQVVEARMAAMQAQVEPHFLFNTLASIDHLIETDPPRASQMQKNLIALLRASMPTMREANNAGPRPLERELAVIRPYLEILKVRMEERLQTEIDVPDGLLSAEFPQMMIQSLVENAIKHGLEPKAEGGLLRVKAEVRHGKLCVTVADTGLGFGKAATGGTGVGLANIRERLQLLYGPKASLTVTENQPSGTVVTITVPYTHRDQEGA